MDNSVFSEKGNGAWVDYADVLAKTGITDEWIGNSTTGVNLKTGIICDRGVLVLQPVRDGGSRIPFSRCS